MIIQTCFMKEGYIRHLKLYPCERVNKRDVVKTGYTTERMVEVLPPLHVK